MRGVDTRDENDEARDRAIEQHRPALRAEMDFIQRTGTPDDPRMPIADAIAVYLEEPYALVRDRGRMRVDEKFAIVRQLHNIEGRDDLGDDEEALVQLQHDLDQLLATAALLLSRGR